MMTGPRPIRPEALWGDEGVPADLWPPRNGAYAQTLEQYELPLHWVLILVGPTVHGVHMRLYNDLGVFQSNKWAQLAQNVQDVINFWDLWLSILQ